MITRVEDHHPHPAVGGFSRLEFTVDDEEYVVHGSFEAVVALKDLLIGMMLESSIHPVEALRDLAEQSGLEVDHESFNQARDACDGDPYRRPRR